MSNKSRLVYGLLAALVIGALAVTWVRTRAIISMPDAAHLLRSAAEAEDTVLYDAQVRSTSSYRGRTMKIESRVRRSDDARRVDYLTGPMPGLVVISSSGQTYTTKPGSGAALATASSVSNPTRLMKLLLQNHDAVISGTSTIAGRRCHVVNIIPKSAAGPSKRLHIDRTTHLVLRNDDLTSTGKLRSSSVITRIDYSPSFDRAIFVASTEAKTQSRAPGLSLVKLSDALGFRVTLPKHVPTGYIADSHRLYDCDCQCGHQSAHMTYTNGLGTISVFQTRSLSHCESGSCKMPQGVAGCAIMDSARGKTAILERKDKAIIVVGDLQDSELKKIARSVP